MPFTWEKQGKCPKLSFFVTCLCRRSYSQYLSHPANSHQSLWADSPAYSTAVTSSTPLDTYSNPFGNVLASRSSNILPTISAAKLSPCLAPSAKARYCDSGNFSKVQIKSFDQNLKRCPLVLLVERRLRTFPDVTTAPTYVRRPLILP